MGSLFIAIAFSAGIYCYYANMGAAFDLITIHVDSSSSDNNSASQGGAIYLQSASKVPSIKVFDNNFVSNRVTGIARDLVNLFLHITGIALEGQFVSGVPSQNGCPNDCCAAPLLADQLSTTCSDAISVLTRKLKKSIKQWEKQWEKTHVQTWNQLTETSSMLTT